MSHLKKKSENNIKAAKKLILEELHSSSVHCSYYACLQFIKYVYIDDETFTSDSQEKDHSSHVVSIKKISNEVYNKTNNKEDKRYIQNTLFDLKKKRTEADYDEVEITKDNAEGALRKAEQVLYAIKNYLEL